MAEFTVDNRHGLHARPAARLVSEVRRLDASVRLRNLTTGAGPVPAGSLSRVATLGALHGHRVEIRASGPQAPEAVDHLLALAARHFDEPLEDAASAQPGAAWPEPLPASPGIGIGPVRRLRPRLRLPTDDPSRAAQRRSGDGSSRRVAAVRREIERIASRSPPARSGRRRRGSSTPT